MTKQEPQKILIDYSLPLMWNLAPIVLNNPSRSFSENPGPSKSGELDTSLIRAGYAFAKNKKEFLKQVIKDDKELQKIRPIKFNIAGLEQILGIQKTMPRSKDPEDQWYSEEIFFPGQEIKTNDWDLILESNKAIKGGNMRYGDYSNWMQAKNTENSRVRFWISPRLEIGKKLEFKLNNMTGYFSYEGFNAGVTESFMAQLPLYYFGDLKSFGVGLSGASNNYIKMYAKKKRYDENAIVVKYTKDSDKKEPFEFEGEGVFPISKVEFDRIIGTGLDKAVINKNNVIMGRMFPQYSIETPEVDCDSLFKNLFNIYQNKEFYKLKGFEFVPFKTPYKESSMPMSFFLDSLDGHGSEHYPHGFDHY